MKNFPARFEDLFKAAVQKFGFETAYDITELILRIFQASLDYETVRRSESVKEER